MLKNKKVIRFNCPHCTVSFVVNCKYVGYNVRCKKCRTKFIIPDTDKNFENSELKFLTFLELAKELLKGKIEPLSVQELWEEAKKNNLLKRLQTKGKTPYISFNSILNKNARDEKSIFIGIGENPRKFILKSNYVSDVTPYNTPVVIPFKISEKYKLRILNLFKTKINSNFLDSFRSQAENRFKKEKWQLNGITPKEIKNYFEIEFCVPKKINERDFILNLEEKIRITVSANQSIVRSIGKIHLILGVIWIKAIDKEVSLTEFQIARIYKILHYFIDIDDFIPDTSQGGYLDDLYISTLAFKGLRNEKRRSIINTLKKELDQ